MIVATSAILAIILAEHGYETLVATVAEADAVPIAAPTVVEAGIVVSARLGSRAPGLIERFLQELRIDVVPFDDVHVAVAVDAFRRYGKGRHAAWTEFRRLHVLRGAEGRGGAAPICRR